MIQKVQIKLQPCSYGYQPLTAIVNSAVVAPTAFSAFRTKLPVWSVVASVMVSLLDVGVASMVSWAVGDTGSPLRVQLVVGVGTPPMIVSMTNFWPPLSVCGDFSWSLQLIVGAAAIAN